MIKAFIDGFSFGWDEYGEYVEYAEYMKEHFPATANEKVGSRLSHAFEYAIISVRRWIHFHDTGI